MYRDVENLDICKDIEELSDDIWNQVMVFDYFAKDTVGKQLIRAADSIGANLFESEGRYHYRDSLNFLYFARGSPKKVLVEEGKRTQFD